MAAKAGAAGGGGHDRLDEQAVAQRCAAWLAERDRVLAALGIVVEAVGPGRARLRLTVGEAMLNSQDICHGGVIFSLADCAFALACNSRGQIAVAADCTIDFVRPGRPGEVLTARAEERYLRGRNGLYEITVSNQDGEPIAFFRGRSRAVGRPLIEGIGEERRRAASGASHGGTANGGSRR